DRHRGAAPGDRGAGTRGVACARRAPAPGGRERHGEAGGARRGRRGPVARPRASAPAGSPGGHRPRARRRGPRLRALPPLRARHFAAHAPDVPFRIWPDVGDPAAVRYLAAWTLPENLATAFPNLEVLFCVGAGVDQLDLSRVPAGITVVRMIEPGLVDGMVEY